MDTFAALFRDIKRERRNRGSILISPTDPPRGVHYITHGYVKLYDIRSDGMLQMISILGPSDIFPIYWALDEHELPLFYETVTNSEISVMSKDRFTRSLEHNAAYTRVAVAVLLRSHRLLQERIRCLELATARERVASHLLFLGNNFGKTDGTNVVLPLPVTDEELAESVNVSRETVNRTLNQLIHEQYIVRRGRVCTIVRRDDLYRLIVGSGTLKS